MPHNSSPDETAMELGQSSSTEIQVHENRLSNFTNPVAKRLNDRQKAKNAKLKSKSFKIKHSLVRLMDFPMDVFLEIATNLEPIDILHFSRVSKHFRSLLNPKNSRYVWIAARRNIEGLPDCPPDLTEAQYASLMFENICRACGVKTVKVDYCLRLRFCSPCFQMNVLKGGTIAKNYQLGKLPPTVYKLLPRTMPAYTPQGLLFSSTNNTFHNMYYVPELRLVVKRFRSLEHDKVALGDFIQEQQTLATQLIQSGKALFDWDATCKQNRQNEKGSLATSRGKSITTKLIELGWDESSFPRYWESDEWRKIMDQPRELTPRIWAQVSPKLIQILEVLREERLVAARQSRIRLRANEFSVLWDEHLLSYPPEDRHFLPNRHDAVLLTSVVVALEEDGGNINVTSERFNAMLPGALVDSSEYKIKVQSDLLEALEGPSGISETSVDASGKDNFAQFNRLYQVSAIFCCRRCNPLGRSHRLLTFPALLSHSDIPERR
ncbi:hypothetical protein BDZ94DRAFT_973698 [Collybia nuda]|uniref:F-box domain-containing protein n=1 Tax=Collybia nuda TaxID=64659 RepID=A0A9P5YGY8_9AGAR|nr:hypothetical protein BDZ94DRAFT_973698 [Collybia nuda]